MSLINVLKNTSLDILRYFSDNAKDNFSKIVIIFIAYGALNFVLKGFIDTFLPFADSALYFPVYLLLQLSFISVVVPLLSGENFRAGTIVPGMKFILFACILWASVFLLSLPVRLIADVVINVFLPDIMPAFFVFFFKVIYGFVVALFIFFMLFSIFDFLKRPALDLPLLNARNVIKNNKLFIAVTALVITLLYVCVPFITQPLYYFVFRMIFGILLMIVYLGLRSKEVEIYAEPVISEPEPPKLPKIRITI